MPAPRVMSADRKTAEEIANALGGAKLSDSGWWSCKCPAHDDRTASLGLKDTNDGKVAWHCRANCTTRAVAEALKRLELIPSLPAKAERKPRARPVATYQYLDADGSLVCETVRYDPKAFKQRRRDPDQPDAWIWDLKGVDRVLYRLPDLLAADPAAPVLLLEGEKDVERAWSVGLIATTTAQGAKSWGKTTNRAALAARRVVIVPDNDVAGANYETAAALDLHSIAASVQILHLPGLPPKGDLSDWLNAGHTIDQLLELIASAPPFDPQAPPPDNLLLLKAGDRAKLTERCIAALNRADVELAVFDRGGLPVVVQIAAEDEPIGHQKTAIRKGTALLKPADEAHVLHALDNLMLTRRLSDGIMVAADPPVLLAKLVVKNGRFRRLLRITRTPTLRADGSIVAEPGYDARSALIYLPDADYPAVPAEPSLDDAKVALARLVLPFRSVPFMGEVDKAVLAALVITLFTRHLYGNAPAFMFRASEAGTGKTLLVDAAAVIATGIEASNAAAAVVDDPQELRKLLTSWTLAGVPLGLFDNFKRGYRIDSPLINKFLTTAIHSDRLLGGNNDLSARVVTTIALTGNRVETGGDAVRRTLVSDIDAGEEHPEDRVFDMHLLTELRRDRVELVIAALTVLRAYVVAGKPTQEACRVPLGSFEEWCAWVRHPLVWAGCADPVASLQKTRATDEERSDLELVMTALHDVFGKERFTAKEAVEKARSGSCDNLLVALDRRPVASGKDAGSISVERIGRYLKANLRRVVTGFRLVDWPDTHTKGSGYGFEVAGGCGPLRGISLSEYKREAIKPLSSDKCANGDQIIQGQENPPQPPSTPRNGEAHDCEVAACEVCGKLVEIGQPGYATTGAGHHAHAGCLS